MEVDSETSEECEDFLPSSLLEVVVKEAENSEWEKYYYYDNSLGEPSSTIPGLEHQYPYQSVQQKQKAMYWRTCSLCKFRELGGKDTTFSYHKFPADEELSLKWRKICNLSDTTDVTYLKVCSKHFTRDDFVDYRAKSWGGTLKLKPGAVPSLCIPNKSGDLETPGQQDNSGITMTSESVTELNAAQNQSSGTILMRKDNVIPGCIKQEPEENSNSCVSPFGMVSTSNKTDQEVPDSRVENMYSRCFLCKFKDYSRISSVSYHKFPSDEKACKLWKQVCNLNDGDNVSSLRLCSKHFHADDYINSRARNDGGVLRLKSGTVPSIGVPKPLSSRPAPTKYFILSNVGGQNSALNEIQPGKVLNLLFRDPATGVIVNSGVPLRTTVMMPNGKNPVLACSSAPKIVFQKPTNLDQAEKISQNTSVAKQVPPSSLTSKQTNVDQLMQVSQKSSVAKQPSPISLTLQNAEHIGQPRVVLKRLSMADINKFQKGLITEEQLTKGLKIKEKPCETKPVAVQDRSNLDPENDNSSEFEKNEGNQKRGPKWRKNWYRYCYLCEKIVAKEGAVSLHKFPQNPLLCKEWVKVCNLTERDDVSSVRICSQHFKPEDVSLSRMKATGFMLKLKLGAIPCINVPSPPKGTGTSNRSQQKPESENEFDPSNLLRIAVNESSPNAYSVDSEAKKDTANAGQINKSGRSCFLCGYKEEIGKQSAITLHKFPDDNMANRLWKQACNLLEHDYMNTSSLLICSNHFIAKDYVDNSKVPGCHRMLRPGAVPSVSVPNYLKPVCLPSFESSEQESTESCDEINPVDLMEITFNEPENPKKQDISMVNPDAMKTNVSDQSNSSLMSQRILTRDLKPQKSLPQSQQNLLVYSKYKDVVKHADVNLVIRDMVDPNAACVSEGLLQMPQLSEKVPVQIQSTIDNTSTKKTMPFGNSVNWNQPVKFLKTNSGQSIPRVPQVKFAMVPPGLLLQTQTLRKGAQVTDNSSQTLAPARLVERSCQTDAECNEDEDEDITDEVMILNDTSPPESKKRRIFHSSVVSCGSESTGPKKITKGAHLKRLTESHMVDEQQRRIKLHINSLEDLFCHLQKRDLLSKDAADILMNITSEEVYNLHDLIVKKLRARGHGAWGRELRTFAMTLRFFSLDAYKYVNNLWPNLVPHVSAINNWFSMKNAKPGFSQEALNAINVKSVDRKEGILCNITISEMTLRQEMVFENNRFYGGVDMGTGQKMQSDSSPKSQSALIFFVTALDAAWSIPVGYFFIKSLNAKERANLLGVCLELLHEVGASVMSITVDGSLVNSSMCCHLGANFLYGERFQPWFLNPVTREKIFVFYDACSMMRLIRDALGDRHVILDSENKYIKWAYIRKLGNVQSELPWEVDTKLTKSHIMYQDNRTDIKLSLQTLSRSVYKAFMSVLEKNMENFDGCCSTAVYCLMFNNIFDMLNCRNRFSKKKYAVPINEDSIMLLRQSAIVFIKYILGLKDNYGTPIVNTFRKTGFLGLIVSLTNIFELYDIGKSLGLKHLLTHKLSLDNVRTFCKAMYNNNSNNNGGSIFLNAKEFECMYRKLILKYDMNSETINYLASGINILRVASQIENFSDPIYNYKNPILVEKEDQEYVNAVISLKPIIGDVIKYVSGLVVNKILSQKFCLVCAEHLIDIKNIQILLKKDKKRKYVVPSVDVCRICRIAKSVLQENGIFTVKQSNIRFLVVKTFERVGGIVFNTTRMKAHLLEQAVFDNHLSQLCHIVIETFLGMMMLQDREV